MSLNTQVVIIQKPKIDFNSFLSVTSQVLGYNPAAVADKSSKSMTDSEKLMLCMQAMKNPDSFKCRDYFLDHMNVSVLIMALESDLLEVTEICAAMPYISTATLRRDVFLGIITGTLRQWREAVAVGCSKDVSMTVGALFTSAYQIFVKEGFGFVWSQYNVKPAAHGQLLLEHNG